MQVAILGYAREGRASLEHWQSLGAEVTVCDQDVGKVVPEGVQTQLGPDYLKNLDRFDLLVRTAGMPPREILAASPGVEDKITTSINEFFRMSPTSNIIGVTGTKGKGTTSTLITKMLEAAGKQVYLGGNIGVPPIELLKLPLKPDDYIVLELSSFQLMDIKYSPHIAVGLMIVPEHLNWHVDMQEYLTAKQHLFSYQKADDIGIYFGNNENTQVIAMAGQGKKIPYFQPPGAYVQNDTIIIDNKIICKTVELQLLGKHNWENVCAAVTAVWQITHDIEAMRHVLLSFTGLPHRLELIREVNAVNYYNDSFASTPEAAMAAMTAITRKKVLIIGGFDRELPLENLAKTLQANQDNIRGVLFIGMSKKRLAAACEQAGFSNFVISDAQDMPAIVKQASEMAQASDAVVLSPGFPSFDMFIDFEDRGHKFRAAVLDL